MGGHPRLGKTWNWFIYMFIYSMACIQDVARISTVRASQVNQRVKSRNTKTSEGLPALVSLHLLGPAGRLIGATRQADAIQLRLHLHHLLGAHLPLLPLPHEAGLRPGLKARARDLHLHVLRGQLGHAARQPGGLLFGPDATGVAHGEGLQRAIQAATATGVAQQVPFNHVAAPLALDSSVFRLPKILESLVAVVSGVQPNAEMAVLR